MAAAAAVIALPSTVRYGQPQQDEDWTLSRSQLIEERCVDNDTHFGSRLAIGKGNPVRTGWTCLITLLLVYTGTLFLYRLCFIDFRMILPGEEVETGSSDWESFDFVVTVIFWVDLFLNFLFTYDHCEEPKEIDDLRLIARRYLESHFLINLVACIPESLVEQLIAGATTEAPDTLNQSVRALRLQRISRLARLMRLTRLAKVRQQRNFRWYQWFERQRGLRVVNLVFGLMWIMHILACGWYLCASLHDSPEDTWVMRRTVGFTEHGEINLGQREPFDQWMHAMYFVLTVFTTVGFGDMSAVTVGEIIYVCITMGIGAVVHSIIISEVISVVMSNDQTNVFIQKQRELVEAFSKHTEVDSEALMGLKGWVDTSAKYWITHKYDRDEMRDIITGKHMPRRMLDTLPSRLFHGQLIRNSFLLVCESLCNIPPRLPLLLALSLNKSTFMVGELIYQAQDYPFNMFLVSSGTFAYVARPSRSGGIVHVPSIDVSRSNDKVDGQSQGLSRRMIDGLRRQSRAFTSSSGAANGSSFRIPCDVQEQFPYLLFSAGAYFGDVELIRTLPRKETARCESSEGVLLSLNKSDFQELTAQFPQFGAKWAKVAVRRERLRLRKLVRLTKAQSYTDLAASTIQVWFRKFVTGQRPLVDQGQARLDSIRIGKQAAQLFETRQNGGIAYLYDKQERMQQQLLGLSGSVGVLSDKLDLLLRRQQGSTDPAMADNISGVRL